MDDNDSAEELTRQCYIDQFRMTVPDRYAQLCLGKTMPALKDGQKRHWAKIKDAISKNWDSYIYGPSGVGKTVVAILAGRLIAHRCRKVRFESASKLCRELHESFNNNLTANEIQYLFSAEMLVLDDVDKMHFTKLSVKFLHELVEHRTSELKPTITTSNLSPGELIEELGRQHGTPIISRLVATPTVVIKMDGEDLRLEHDNHV